MSAGVDDEVDTFIELLDKSAEVKSLMRVLASQGGDTQRDAIEGMVIAYALKLSERRSRKVGIGGNPELAQAQDTLKKARSSVRRAAEVLARLSTSQLGEPQMVSALEKMGEGLSHKLLWTEALHELTKAKRRKQSAGAPRKSHAVLAECVDDVLEGAVENQAERVKIAQALIRDLLDPKSNLEVEQLRSTVRSARARKRGGWRGMKAESGSLWKEVGSVDVGKVPKPQARKIERVLGLPKAKKRSPKKP